MYTHVKIRLLEAKDGAYRPLDEDEILINSQKNKSGTTTQRY